MIRISISPVVLLLFLTGCDLPPLCANTIVEVAVSPAGDRKAVLFERNCGATTGFSSQVSILKANEKLAGGGNTFIADGSMTVRAGYWGGPYVELKWISAEELLVLHAAGARLFKNERQVRGVTVSYRVLED